MNPHDRNEAVSQAINSYFDRAKEAKDVTTEEKIESDLDLLFSTTSSGFREVVLVVLHARLVDNEYQASLDFYACKPRALYEGPIRTALIERAIPHRKSGPLNVAKAVKAINDEWAEPKEEAAAATVRLVKRIEQMSAEELDAFALAFHRKLLDAAVAAASLNVELEPESDPLFLFALTVSMIREVPDAGNTPQRIAGLLLHSYHEDVGSGVTVAGWEDRASVTSTTSKKAGDIAEERKDGTIIQCYEVTVKAFGESRVEECTESFIEYNTATKSQIAEVVVLCRPGDCHPDAKTDDDSDLLLGTYVHRGFTYQFVDLYEWIIAQLLRMAPSARMAFFRGLHDYVNHPNTAEAVKKFWKSFHEKQAELGTA